MALTEELTKQQIFMEMLRSDTVRRLSAGVDLTAEAYIDLAGEMQAVLTAHVLAEKLVEETQTVCFWYPAGPWQAFKKKWLRRQPKLICVKKEVTFRRYKTAPNSTQPWPKSFGDPVIVEMVDFSGDNDER